MNTDNVVELYPTYTLTEKGYAATDAHRPSAGEDGAE